MASSRPFAYNPIPPGSPISGTTQFVNLAIGVLNEPYDEDYGGVKWWEGPSELTGYIICQPIPDNSQPTPISGTTASVGFYRTSGFTDISFLKLCNSLPARNRQAKFKTTNEATAWLDSVGYWTNYIAPTPTPTTTNTPTPTLTPTNTTTPTYTPTHTSTPSTTPVYSPLDFTLNFTCGGPGGTSVTLNAIMPVGGTGIYYFSTNYFLSEADAIANTSWTRTDGRGWGAGLGDYTYWVALKDSVDNKVVKSVTSNCNPSPTPTPTPTVTPTNTATNTPTPSYTPTYTPTPTATLPHYLLQEDLSALLQEDGSYIIY
jgi:hypothetical protein